MGRAGMVGDLGFENGGVMWRGNGAGRVRGGL
jgi:hypothetical protein